MEVSPSRPASSARACRRVAAGCERRQSVLIVISHRHQAAGLYTLCSLLQACDQSGVLCRGSQASVGTFWIGGGRATCLPVQSVQSVQRAAETRLVERLLCLPECCLTALQLLHSALSTLRTLRGRLVRPRLHTQAGAGVC